MQRSSGEFIIRCHECVARFDNFRPSSVPFRENECVHRFAGVAIACKGVINTNDGKRGCTSFEESAQESADPFKRRIQIEVNFEFETETGFGTLWNLNEMHNTAAVWALKKLKIAKSRIFFEFQWRRRQQRRPSPQANEINCYSSLVARLVVGDHLSP